MRVDEGIGGDAALEAFTALSFLHDEVVKEVLAVGERVQVGDTVDEPVVDAAAVGERVLELVADNDRDVDAVKDREGVLAVASKRQGRTTVRGGRRCN